jgi:hypothetical protein
MKTGEEKKDGDKVEVTPEKKNDFYLNEKAKEWEYSDYVRLTPGPRGMVLSFGKFIRENNKYGIFKEILLPYDVADALSNVIKQQFENLIEKGLIEKIESKDKS